jgi:hypothetical protein
VRLATSDLITRELNVDGPNRDDDDEEEEEHGSAIATNAQRSITGVEQTVGTATTSSATGSR